MQLIFFLNELCETSRYLAAENLVSEGKTNSSSILIEPNQKCPRSWAEYPEMIRPVQSTTF